MRKPLEKLRPCGNTGWITTVLIFMLVGCTTAQPSEDVIGATDIVLGDFPTYIHCGDGECAPDESAASCPSDCGSNCGDSVCSDAETPTNCAVDCTSECGNGECTGGESTLNCPADCGAACGDGVCDASETSAECPKDCSDACGDGSCSDEENTVNCVADCGPSCGDGTCNGEESSSTCPNDCGASCGDGQCNGPETSASCVVDCGPTCGDGACNGDESSLTCVKDCGSMCGDGTCNGEETTLSCSEDCGDLCGDGTCNGTENTTNCPGDCGSLCGDGSCNGDESSTNCVDDCGTDCGDGVCNGDESVGSCPADCKGECAGCGPGFTCVDGACACVPEPHYKVVDGECLPSCGSLQGAMNWADSTCCADGCADGSVPPSTWDCDFCCAGESSCIGSPPACEPETCASLGVECGVVDDGCDGTLNCGPCDPGGDCEVPPLGAPSVGLDDRSFADDAGPFLGLGASLFWAAWGYKFDIEKLEQNLQFLADSGFNSFRALGVVGDVDEEDYWDGREIDPNWPDYAEVIAGVTDLAYDEYGLRVQWTLIGDGQVTVPSTAEKYALADAFLAMSQGREHKIMLFETANEYWLNGFPGEDGLQELREITSYLRSSTDILVAASAPAGHECEDAQVIYDGCIADVATIHFDRDISKVEGSWRPVRQPWEHQFCELPAGSNNEPIGPGASVNTETNPLKLVSGAIVTYISGLPIIGRSA